MSDQILDYVFWVVAAVMLIAWSVKPRSVIGQAVSLLLLLWWSILILGVVK